MTELQFQKKFGYGGRGGLAPPRILQLHREYVNIKVKGSGQECPLHTINTKFKIKGRVTCRLIGRLPGSARMGSPFGCAQGRLGGYPYMSIAAPPPLLSTSQCGTKRGTSG
jgi:hypothetical protein